MMPARKQGQVPTSCGACGTSGSRSTTGRPLLLLPRLLPRRPWPLTPCWAWIPSSRHSSSPLEVPCCLISSCSHSHCSNKCKMGSSSSSSSHRHRSKAAVLGIPQAVMTVAAVVTAVMCRVISVHAVKLKVRHLFCRSWTDAGATTNPGCRQGGSRCSCPGPRCSGHAHQVCASAATSRARRPAAPAAAGDSVEVAGGVAAAVAGAACARTGAQVARARA
mmetsp:Transcript_2722/g.7018  ORF Transcript_2722/g.7018 Transcript_2722/m.7018 type:complete len:220 (-) Transcript_2722:374-1033(-)